MNNRIFSKLLILFVIFLAACGTAPDLPGSEVPPAETFIVPTPSEGKGSVTGRLTYSDGGEPLNNIGIRLAEVVRNGEEGAFLLDIAFSPGTYTNEDGYFVFADLEPMEYVLIIGDVYSDYEVINDESGKAKAWKVDAGAVVDTGSISVSIPKP